MSVLSAVLCTCVLQLHQVEYCNSERLAVYTYNVGIRVQHGNG